MDVRTAQEILNNHGFPCGTPDGVAGQLTAGAIGHFQLAYDGDGGWLTIDGKFGPQTANALQWVQDHDALVTYFSIQEVACHHCGRAYVQRNLLSAMFKLRQAIGPVACLDAYRCPIHNADVGGANNSQHLAGEGFDPPKGRVTIAQARAAGACPARTAPVVAVDRSPSEQGSPGPHRYPQQNAEDNYEDGGHDDHTEDLANKVQARVAHSSIPCS